LVCHFEKTKNKKLKLKDWGGKTMVNASSPLAYGASHFPGETPLDLAFAVISQSSGLFSRMVM
jgi:hypothetical protein